MVEIHLPNKTSNFWGYFWCSIDFLGSLFLGTPVAPPGCGGCGGPCGPGGGPCGPPMGCGGPGGPGGDSDQQKREGCFGGMVYSKVVSTHLWNTPRATFTNGL